MGEYARELGWVAWKVSGQHHLAEDRHREVAACRRLELNEVELDSIKATIESLTRHLTHRRAGVHALEVDDQHITQ